MNRRQFLVGAAIGTAFLPLATFGAPSTYTTFAELERRSGGRLGVFAHDLETGRRLVHRPSERFLMCSTFKLLAVAAVLNRVDKGSECLDRRIYYGRDVLLSHAPVTSLHADGEGMTVGQLCDAAITVSDNTAGNLLLQAIGGPDGFNVTMRAFGDTATRLDRTEPKLNIASGVLDTTTPEAMGQVAGRLLSGGLLMPTSVAKLSDWLRAATPGLTMLRAGFPAEADAGDKAGRGTGGQNNDIAIVWKQGKKPLLVAAYYVNSDMDDGQRNAVLAEVGRVVAARM
ncbi:class A beta-lactamase [Luteibacter sp. OK325]|uniref:class A beta-lactamase n=1 Tax=Luteibacter sp. OK325 TaxID=2135670 RepID=UPI000D33CCB9|nr:class A beta-lactamase [Luteibacter sp. OK325]